MSGQATSERRVDYLPLHEIARASRNPKRHDVDGIRVSIGRFGVAELPLLDERTGRLVAGHGRLDDLTARHDAGEDPPDGVRLAPDGAWLVPVVRGWSSRSDPEADAYLVASNQLTVNGGWDDAALAELLAELNDVDPDLLELTGFGEEDLADLLADRGGAGEGTGGVGDPEERPNLADRFVIPPFDVLDARQGWWRTRKQQWLALGIQSEIGRGHNLAFADITSADPGYYAKKTVAEREAGRPLSHDEFQAATYGDDAPTGTSTGTSIFDPVLCELVVRWFTAPDAAILDPFAGGSVRGIVAGVLGRSYLGNDLSVEQVEANRGQVADIVPDARIDYTVGDSADWVHTLAAESVDLILTCPPYYDLERYSDDPADLSAMTHAAFDQAYAQILAGAVRALRPDRFAVIVTGDARDGRGALHDLRGATVRAMEAAGCTVASAGVLVTAVGSAAMRAARQFVATRTLARCHQDVLVFVKGDRHRATDWCGEVDLHVPDEMASGEQDPDPTG